MASDKKSHYVTLADFVTNQEGTGIVHIAPAFGEDDFNLGKQLDLPIYRTVDEEGRIAKEVSQWMGIFVKEADNQIMEELTQRSLLYRHEKIKHTYPFCWRCDSPLLSYSLKTWFIKVSEVRERLVETNMQINWVPEHVKEGRFGNWLENARDWNVSRNRYWGTPLPIWECHDCGHQLCVGSLEELKQYAAESQKNDIEDLDLHRPFIDDIKLLCPNCGKPAVRVEEVLDCWFESGSMPYAQEHYPFENKYEFENSFPADFIAEGMDQTRGWFYTLHVIANILFDKPAFSNVIVNGIGLDEKGVKLSKRLRNYTEPEVLMDKAGADAMRYFFFAGTPMGEDWRFSEKLVIEKMRKVLMTWWNSYVFFTTYASIDDWDPQKAPEVKAPEQNVLDKWIMSRLQSLINQMTESFERYDLTKAARPIEGFINEMSTWYIRRSRRRFWKTENDDDKNSAYSTLYTVLITLTKLTAPIMPFISEEIYQDLVVSFDPSAPESVHLCLYPEVDTSLIDQQLESNMDKVQQIVEMARALRSKVGIKIRQPLKELRIWAEDLNLEQELEEIIIEEINVKKMVVAEQIPDYYLSQETDDLKVTLDPTLTEELKREGMIRDLVREIQSARKKAGLQIEDHINLDLLFESAELTSAIQEWREYLLSETLCQDLKVQDDHVSGSFQTDFEVQRVQVKLGISKAS